MLILGREAAGCYDSVFVLSGGKGEKDSDSTVAALRMSDAPTGSEGMCLTETSKNNCANESPAHLQGSEGVRPSPRAHQPLPPPSWTLVHFGVN